MVEPRDRRLSANRAMAGRDRLDDFESACSPAAFKRDNFGSGCAEIPITN